MQIREVADEIGAGVLGLGFAPTWRLDECRPDAQGPLRDHAALHAEGRRLWPRDDVPHLHGAGESRFRRRSRHGEEIPRRRWRCSPSPPRCSPIRRSAKDSRTAFFPTAARSGPTSTMRARGCCPSCSKMDSASSAMSITRSMCRCISSIATAAISTWRGRASAISWRGRIPELKNIEPQLADWADHLTTIFPEVRLKRFLEMRGADGGTWRRICGMPALCGSASFMIRSALDAAWDLVKDWTCEEREAMRAAVPVLAFKTPFRGRTVARSGARHARDFARRSSRRAQEKIRSAPRRKDSCIR